MEVLMELPKRICNLRFLKVKFINLELEELIYLLTIELANAIFESLDFLLFFFQLLLQGDHLRTLLFKSWRTFFVLPFLAIFGCLPLHLHQLLMQLFSLQLQASLLFTQSQLVSRELPRLGSISEPASQHIFHSTHLFFVEVNRMKGR